MIVRYKSRVKGFENNFDLFNLAKSILILVSPHWLRNTFQKL